MFHLPWLARLSVDDLLEEARARAEDSLAVGELKQSAAVIPACVFGSESAKMIGLSPAPLASCTATIASTTSLVNGEAAWRAPYGPHQHTSGLKYSMIALVSNRSSYEHLPYFTSPRSDARSRSEVDAYRDHFVSFGRAMSCKAYH